MLCVVNGDGEKKGNNRVIRDGKHWAVPGDRRGTFDFNWGRVLSGCEAGAATGRLPGDIRIEGKNGSFYFPVVTSLVLSLVLTIVLNIIVRLFRK